MAVARSNPAGLDYTAVPNQYARVDLIKSSASLFDTGTGVLRNFYLGVDAGANPHSYTDYNADITSLVAAGGTFTLRFAEVNNMDILDMGIDSVSIVTSASTVPEPATIAFGMMGLLGLVVAKKRRRE